MLFQIHRVVEVSRDSRGRKVRETTGGNVIQAGPRGFAKALDFEFAKSLFVFEKPETGANNLADVGKTAIANIRIDKLFEVGSQVDVLSWHRSRTLKLAKIVNSDNNGDNDFSGWSCRSENFYTGGSSETRMDVVFGATQGEPMRWGWDNSIWRRRKK